MRGRWRTLRRSVGVLLLVLGPGAIAEAVVTVTKGEPVTGYLAHRAQRTLQRELEVEVRTPALLSTFTRPSGGHALGRIAIPRIGLNAVVVEGTRHGDLERGPGHYPETDLPGRGDTVAIAGHRTTWGAWFRHVDQLRRGDRITLTLAYGTVVYRVTGQRVVEPDDWSILRDRGYHQLMLSTCDPPFSASHRRIVFAREVGHRFRRGIAGLRQTAASSAAA